MHHVKFDMLCEQMDEEWVEKEQEKKFRVSETST